MSRYTQYFGKNNVKSELAVGISSIATTIQVNENQGNLRGEKFPVLGTLEHFDSTGKCTKREIVKVESKNGDSFTVVRKFAPCPPSDDATSQSAVSSSFDPGDSFSVYIPYEILNAVSEAINDLYNNGNDRLFLKKTAGLGFEITPGNVRFETGEAYYPGGTGTVVDNATNYIMLDSSFNILVETTELFDVQNISIAEVVAVNGEITQITTRKIDGIAGRMGGGPDPVYGDGSDGDLVISENTILNAGQQYQFSNLTICPGVVVSFSGCGGAKIRVAGTFINEGTIDTTDIDVDNHSYRDSTSFCLLSNTKYTYTAYGQGGNGGCSGRTGGKGGNAITTPSGSSDCVGSGGSSVSGTGPLSGGAGGIGYNCGGGGGGGGKGCTGSVSCSSCAGCPGNGLNGGDGGDGVQYSSPASCTFQGGGGGGGGGYYTGKGGNGGNSGGSYMYPCYLSAQCATCYISTECSTTKAGGDGGNGGVLGNGGNGGNILNCGESSQSFGLWGVSFAGGDGGQGICGGKGGNGGNSYCIYKGGKGGKGGNGYYGGQGGNGGKMFAFSFRCQYTCSCRNTTCLGGDGGQGGDGVVPGKGGNGGGTIDYFETTGYCNQYICCSNVHLYAGTGGQGGTGCSSLHSLNIKAKHFCNLGCILSVGSVGGQGGDGGSITCNCGCNKRVYAGNGGKGGTGGKGGVIQIITSEMLSHGCISVAGGVGGQGGAGGTNCNDSTRNGTNGANGSQGASGTLYLFQLEG